jgi:hypothetical protein
VIPKEIKNLIKRLFLLSLAEDLKPRLPSGKWIKSPLTPDQKRETHNVGTDYKPTTHTAIWRNNQ